MYFKLTKITCIIIILFNSFFLFSQEQRKQEKRPVKIGGYFGGGFMFHRPINNFPFHYDVGIHFDFQNKKHLKRRTGLVLQYSRLNRNPIWNDPRHYYFNGKEKQFSRNSYGRVANRLRLGVNFQFTLYGGRKYQLFIAPGIFAGTNIYTGYSTHISIFLGPVLSFINEFKLSDKLFLNLRLNGLGELNVGSIMNISWINSATLEIGLSYSLY